MDADSEMGTTGIQAYFKKRCVAAGALVDHFATPGKVGPPDFLVTWLREPWPALLELVECKGKNGRLSERQKRDHAKRAKHGHKVVHLWTKSAVDAYVEFRRG